MALVALRGQCVSRQGRHPGSKLTRESTLPVASRAAASLARSVRLRPSSHARMSAAVPSAPTGERAAAAPPESGEAAPGDPPAAGRRLWPALLVAALLLGILAAGLWI